MSGWRDQLQQASWRGVPFLVDGHETHVGRRGQVHEFPQRDIPYVEDLGRRARLLTVEAYVLGADYLVQRDQLMAALELPGNGTLVHPYFGEMQAALVDCSVRESTAEGGLARLTLRFVEAGTLTFPTAVASTASQVETAADAAAAAVQSSFELYHQVQGLPAFVADASQTIFGRALDSIIGGVRKVRGAAAEVAALQRQVDTWRRELGTLIYTPAAAAQALVSGIRQLVRSVATAPRDALSLARTLFDFGIGLAPVAPSTPTRQVQARNQAELVRAVRLAAAAEGARAAAGVAWESYGEAATARDALVSVLDAVMLDDGVPDAVFEAARALQTAVVRDVAARSANLARVVQWTPVATAPALVLAQQLYADGQRAADLVLRNRVRHPLFVPGSVALEVLSDG